jgi:hypothetical protein
MCVCFEKCMYRIYWYILYVWYIHISIYSWQMSTGPKASFVKEICLKFKEKQLSVLGLPKGPNHGALEGSTK